MTDSQKVENLMEYMRDAYPRGMRSSADDSSALVNKYDNVRAEVIETYKEIMETAVSRLLIATADLSGVVEWEKMLYINPLEGSSLAERIAEIQALLIGNDTSLATLKTVLNTLFGSSGYTITELFRTSSDPDDVWSYVVSVEALVENLGNFNKKRLTALIEKVHPAHCNLRLEINPNIEDSIGVEDTNVEYGVHAQFQWGVSNWADYENDRLRGDMW